VGGILSFFEVIQILSFFCFIFHLQRLTDNINVQRERLHCRISGYTIVVHNIPKDTTVQQIHDHFNELYPLDRIDSAGRPPIAGAMTVKNTDNTRNPLYMNTWINECILLKKIGKFIKIFREKEKLMIRLYRYIYIYVYIYNTFVCVFLYI
jgi:hypothetical protein